MQKHTKVYFKHFDYATQSEILCEACGRPAADIHHIYGRGKGMDNINNLMALCRDCHSLAHKSKLSKEYLQSIHNRILQNQ